MNEGRDVLIYLAVKYDGDYQKILNAVNRGENPTISEVNDALASIKAKTITILDLDYPSYLRKMDTAPIVLFYYGDISLINDENYEKNVGIIGTREPTSYGLKATEEISGTISRRYNVVSGLARGIDAAAHQACIDNNGKTIAVLGSGIDNIYPLENTKLFLDILERGGLVLSEYPNLSEPAMYHFPVRDRIIAQLSKAVIVTEAYGRTGTSYTVGFALQMGKDVLALPYPYFAYDSFCNQLLYEGAIFIRDGNDALGILERFYSPKNI